MIIAKLRRDFHDRPVSGERVENAFVTIATDSGPVDLLRSTVTAEPDGTAVGRIPGLFWGLFPDREIAGRIAEDRSVTIRDAGDGKSYVFDAGDVRPTDSGYEATKPGIRTILKRANPLVFVFAFIILLVINVGLGTRWWLLLRVQDIPIPWWAAVRYNYIGLFFNSMLPGLTGGDLVKIYYAVRETHRKAHAAATVLLDRAIGLFAMGLLAVFAISLSIKNPTLRQVRIPEAIYLFMGLVVAGSLVFFSRKLRRVLRVERLLDRLPFTRIVRELNEAVFVYRYHRGASAAVMGISVVMHFMAFTTYFLCGRTLGITQLGYVHYVLFLPIILAISSLPISLSGLGVRETLFALLFGLMGAPATIAVMLSLLYFFIQLLSNLPGALFYALQKGKATREQIDQTLQQDAVANDVGGNP